LTGQDIGAYGKDVGVKLTDLVRRVVEIPGEFRVRLGMMNPNWVGEMLGEILDLYRNPKIYKFAHLPVQSGSDTVLEAMLRPYKVRDFVQIVEALRENVPQITIATDMIVGFPTERDEDFALSLELVRKTRPDIVNISKYAPRAGTAASRMKKLPVWIVSERSKLLSSTCAQISLESNLRMIGFEECVYVTASNSKGKSIGRTSNYKIVILQDSTLLGKMVLAKIIKAYPRYLEGTVLEFNQRLTPDN
jgi:MiaB/RimO family radical SAM methylthiotransferase